MAEELFWTANTLFGRSSFPQQILMHLVCDTNYFNKKRSSIIFYILIKNDKIFKVETY
jgi:hypothetical protein